jgi:hypothetical protein
MLAKDGEVSDSPADVALVLTCCRNGEGSVIDWSTREDSFDEWNPDRSEICCGSAPEREEALPFSCEVIVPVGYGSAYERRGEEAADAMFRRDPMMGEVRGLVNGAGW